TSDRARGASKAPLAFELFELGAQGPGGTPTPAPWNCAQFRLNRLPPVAPPVTARNTKKSSCVPDSEIGKFWLDQTAVPPVEVSASVWTIGPVTVSWCTSMAASGEPAVRPAAASATRKVTELMFTRLKGPFSWIQSPSARLPRWMPGFPGGPAA